MTYRNSMSAKILIMILTMSSIAAAAAPDHDDLGCLAAAKQRFLAAKSLGPVAAGTTDYEVRHWRLEIDVDPDTRTFGGRMTVHFAPTTLDAAEFVLDSSGLAIRAVDHLSGPLTYVQAGDSLVIDLPATKLGSQDSLTVTYEGLMSTDGDGLSWRAWEDTEAIGASVATMSQPEFSRAWWPTKDRPGDKATAVIVITAPDDLTAVSNGVFMGTMDNGDGTATTTWRTDHQIATYLIAIYVSDYVAFGEVCTAPLSGPIDLMHWVYPHHETAARQDFTHLCDMMGFMENLAGPYPFADEKYGHAEFMNMNTGAMEHQTVTGYGHGLLLGNNAYDRIVLHELAHMWYGDSLTPASWKDIWLNEGFATYCETLWFEHLNGPDGPDGYWWRMGLLRSGLNWEGRTPIYDPFPNILDRTVYDKGAWVLHMLRGRMSLRDGDDGDFFDLLRDWSDSIARRESVVTSEQFIAMASEYADEDLAPFLWPYLVQNTVPHLTVRSVAGDGPNGPGTRAEISVVDTGGVAFDNLYPVRIVTEAGEEWRTLRVTGVNASGHFDFLSSVETVELDPKGWLAWSANPVPNATLRIVSTGPNPSAGDVVVTFHLEATADVSLEVYDLRGRLLNVLDAGTVTGSLIDDVDITWNGHDDAGRPMPSGLYWFRLRAGEHTALSRATIIH